MNRPPRRWLAEATFAGITLSAGVILYIIAPHYVSGWAFNIPGTTDVALAPAFFPRFAAVVVVVASILVLISIPMRNEPIPLHSTKLAEIRKVSFGATGIFIYLLGVNAIGFVTASAAFIILASWAGGFRRPVALILIAVLVSLALRWVFRFGLHVNLPTGAFI